MKLYKCKVRLGGNIQHEVPKTDVTAAEIAVLKRIHGEGSVVDVKPLNRDAMTEAIDEDGEATSHKRTDREERARLGEIYSFTSQDKTLSGADLVREAFGAAGQPLPVEYESDEAPADEDEAPKPRRGRPPVVARTPADMME